MKVKHLISGQFSFHVCTYIDRPRTHFMGNKYTLLNYLEQLSKEELLEIIYNGSYTERPRGISELDKQKEEGETK